MTKEKALALIKVKFICMVRANKSLCNWYCESCPLHYEIGTVIEQIEAFSIIIKELECKGGDIK